MDDILSYLAGVKKYVDEKDKKKKALLGSQIGITDEPQTQALPDLLRLDNIIELNNPRNQSVTPDKEIPKSTTFNYKPTPTNFEQPSVKIDKTFGSATAPQWDNFLPDDLSRYIKSERDYKTTKVGGFYDDVKTYANSFIQTLTQDMVKPDEMVLNNLIELSNPEKVESMVTKYPAWAATIYKVANSARTELEQKVAKDNETLVSVGKSTAGFIGMLPSFLLGAAGATAILPNASGLVKMGISEGMAPYLAKILQGVTTFGLADVARNMVSSVEKATNPVTGKFDMETLAGTFINKTLHSGMMGGLFSMAHIGVNAFNQKLYSAINNIAGISPYSFAEKVSNNLAFKISDKLFRAIEMSTFGAGLGYTQRGLSGEDVPNGLKEMVIDGLSFMAMELNPHKGWFATEASSKYKYALKVIKGIEQHSNRKLTPHEQNQITEGIMVTELSNSMFDEMFTYLKSNTPVPFGLTIKTGLFDASGKEILKVPIATPQSDKFFKREIEINNKRDNPYRNLSSITNQPIILNTKGGPVPVASILGGQEIAKLTLLTSKLYETPLDGNIKLTQEQVIEKLRTLHGVDLTNFQRNYLEPIDKEETPDRYIFNKEVLKKIYKQAAENRPDIKENIIKLASEVASGKEVTIPGLKKSNPGVETMYKEIYAELAKEYSSTKKIIDFDEALFEATKEQNEHTAAELNSTKVDQLITESISTIRQKGIFLPENITDVSMDDKATYSVLKPFLDPNYTSAGESSFFRTVQESVKKENGDINQGMRKFVTRNLDFLKKSGNLSDEFIENVVPRLEDLYYQTYKGKKEIPNLKIITTIKNGNVQLVAKESNGTVPVEKNPFDSKLKSFNEQNNKKIIIAKEWTPAGGETRPEISFTLNDYKTVNIEGIQQLIEVNHTSKNDKYLRTQEFKAKAKGKEFTTTFDGINDGKANYQEESTLKNFFSNDGNNGWDTVMASFKEGLLLIPPYDKRTWIALQSDQLKELLNFGFTKTFKLNNKGVMGPNPMAYNLINHVITQWKESIDLPGNSGLKETIKLFKTGIDRKTEQPMQGANGPLTKAEFLDRFTVNGSNGNGNLKSAQQISENWAKAIEEGYTDGSLHATQNKILTELLYTTELMKVVSMAYQGSTSSTKIKSLVKNIPVSTLLKRIYLPFGDKESPNLNRAEDIYNEKTLKNVPGYETLTKNEDGKLGLNFVVFNETSKPAYRGADDKAEYNKTEYAKIESFEHWNARHNYLDSKVLDGAGLTRLEGIYLLRELLNLPKSGSSVKPLIGDSDSILYSKLAIHPTSKEFPLLKRLPGHVFGIVSSTTAKVFSPELKAKQWNGFDPITDNHVVFVPLEAIFKVTDREDGNGTSAQLARTLGGTQISSLATQKAAGGLVKMGEFWKQLTRHTAQNSVKNVFRLNNIIEKFNTNPEEAITFIKKAFVNNGIVADLVHQLEQVAGTGNAKLLPHLYEYNALLEKVYGSIYKLLITNREPGFNATLKPYIKEEFIGGIFNKVAISESSAKNLTWTEVHNTTKKIFGLLGNDPLKTFTESTPEIKEEIVRLVESLEIPGKKTWDYLKKVQEHITQSIDENGHMKDGYVALGSRHYEQYRTEIYNNNGKLAAHIKTPSESPHHYSIDQKVSSILEDSGIMIPEKLRIPQGSDTDFDGIQILPYLPKEIKDFLSFSIGKHREIADTNLKESSSLSAEWRKEFTRLTGIEESPGMVKTFKNSTANFSDTVKETTKYMQNNIIGYLTSPIKFITALNQGGLRFTGPDGLLVDSQRNENFSKFISWSQYLRTKGVDKGKEVFPFELPKDFSKRAIRNMLGIEDPVSLYIMGKFNDFFTTATKLENPVSENGLRMSLQEIRSLLFDFNEQQTFLKQIVLGKNKFAKRVFTDDIANIFFTTSSEEKPLSLEESKIKAEAIADQMFGKIRFDFNKVPSIQGLNMLSQVKFQELDPGLEISRREMAYESMLIFKDLSTSDLSQYQREIKDLSAGMVKSNPIHQVFNREIYNQKVTDFFQNNLKFVDPALAYFSIYNEPLSTNKETGKQELSYKMNKIKEQFISTTSKGDLESLQLYDSTNRGLRSPDMEGNQKISRSVSIFPNMPKAFVDNIRTKLINPDELEANKNSTGVLEYKFDNNNQLLAVKFSTYQKFVNSGRYKDYFTNDPLRESSMTTSDNIARNRLNQLESITYPPFTKTAIEAVFKVYAGPIGYGGIGLDPTKVDNFSIALMDPKSSLATKVEGTELKRNTFGVKIAGGIDPGNTKLFFEHFGNTLPVDNPTSKDFSLKSVSSLSVPALATLPLLATLAYALRQGIRYSPGANTAAKFYENSLKQFPEIPKNVVQLGKQIMEATDPNLKIDLAQSLIGYTEMMMGGPTDFTKALSNLVNSPLFISKNPIKSYETALSIAQAVFTLQHNINIGNRKTGLALDATVNNYLFMPFRIANEFSLKTGVKNANESYNIKVAHPFGMAPVDSKLTFGMTNAWTGKPVDGNVLIPIGEAQKLINTVHEIVRVINLPLLPVTTIQALARTDIKVPRELPDLLRQVILTEGIKFNNDGSISYEGTKRKFNILNGLESYGNDFNHLTYNESVSRIQIDTNGLNEFINTHGNSLLHKGMDIPVVQQILLKATGNDYTIQDIQNGVKQLVLEKFNDQFVIAATENAISGIETLHAEAIKSKFNIGLSAQNLIRTLSNIKYRLANSSNMPKIPISDETLVSFKMEEAREDLKEFTILRNSSNKEKPDYHADLIDLAYRVTNGRLFNLDYNEIKDKSSQEIINMIAGTLGSRYGIDPFKFDREMTDKQFMKDTDEIIDEVIENNKDFFIADKLRINMPVEQSAGNLSYLTDSSKPAKSYLTPEEQRVYDIYKIKKLYNSESGLRYGPEQFEGYYKQINQLLTNTMLTFANSIATSGLAKENPLARDSAITYMRSLAGWNWYFPKQTTIGKLKVGQIVNIPLSDVRDATIQSGEMRKEGGRIHTIDSWSSEFFGNRDLDQSMPYPELPLKQVPKEKTPLEQVRALGKARRKDDTPPPVQDPDIPKMANEYDYTSTEPDTSLKPGDTIEINGKKEIITDKIGKQSSPKQLEEAYNHYEKSIEQKEVDRLNPTPVRTNFITGIITEVTPEKIVINSNLSDIANIKSKEDNLIVLKKSDSNLSDPANLADSGETVKKLLKSIGKLAGNREDTPEGMQKLLEWQEKPAKVVHIIANILNTLQATGYIGGLRVFKYAQNTVASLRTSEELGMSPITNTVNNILNYIGSSRGNPELKTRIESLFDSHIKGFGSMWSGTEQNLAFGASSRKFMNAWNKLKDFKESKSLGYTKEDLLLELSKASGEILQVVATGGGIGARAESTTRKTVLDFELENMLGKERVSSFAEISAQDAKDIEPIMRSVLTTLIPMMFGGYTPGLKGRVHDTPVSKTMTLFAQFQLAMVQRLTNQSIQKLYESIEPAVDRYISNEIFGIDPNKPQGRGKSVLGLEKGKPFVIYEKTGKKDKFGNEITIPKKFYANNVTSKLKRWKANFIISAATGMFLNYITNGILTSIAKSLLGDDNSKKVADAYFTINEFLMDLPEKVSNYPESTTDIEQSVVSTGLDIATTVNEMTTPQLDMTIPGLEEAFTKLRNIPDPDSSKFYTNKYYNEYLNSVDTSGNLNMRSKTPMIQATNRNLDRITRLKEPKDKFNKPYDKLTPAQQKFIENEMHSKFVETGTNLIRKLPLGVGVNTFITQLFLRTIEGVMGAGSNLSPIEEAFLMALKEEEKTQLFGAYRALTSGNVSKAIGMEKEIPLTSKFLLDLIPGKVVSKEYRDTKERWSRDRTKQDNRKTKEEINKFYEEYAK